ncbi:MAG: hypothetical protein N2645_06705 [Clostridia bacterium]|nr:hypothetical protein [Clostridia bacterium]
MSKPLTLAIVFISVFVIALGGFYIFRHFTGSHSPNDASHGTPDASLQETHAPDGGKNECAENINMLQTAVDKFKADKGTYPSKITELADRYVKEIPTCPGGNGYSIDKDGRVFEDSNYKKPESTEPQAAKPQATEPPVQKTFTKEELAKYNGKDGRPCYVALNGVVYDITNVKGWKNGGHGHGILAGKDWTAAFEKFAPKGHKKPDFLKKLTVVGIYVGEKSNEIPKQLDKH